MILADIPLYEVVGYCAIEYFQAEAAGGVPAPLVRMGKTIARSSPAAQLFDPLFRPASNATLRADPCHRSGGFRQ